MKTKACCFLLVAALTCALSFLGCAKCSEPAAVEAPPPNADRLMLNENAAAMSEEELGAIIKDFGKHIKDVMGTEMDKLIIDVEKGSETHGSRLDKRELEKFNKAQQSATENTQARIEIAGTKNNGEFTQSYMGVAGSSLLTKVSAQLHSAGTFIADQMSKLSGLAPKIKGKFKTIPGKLRKLMNWPHFLNFKIKFNKVYKSPSEELYRQIVYIKNQAIVGVHNLKYLLGKVRHLLKPTQFADLTGKDYEQIYDNKGAETENNLPNGSVDLDAKSKNNMAKLATMKKNVFGHSMNEVIEMTREQNEHQLEVMNKEKEEFEETSRTKRSPTYNELDDSEESDDEDLMDLDDNDQKPESESKTANGGDTEMLDADFLIVDEYANEFGDDADLDHLDEMEAIMDQALEETTQDFEPIDLRHTGCIIPPENQDKCGCCYAHVTAAAASYYNCMQAKAPKPTRYNARFTSDCGRFLTADGERLLLDGCSGGKLSQAVRFTSMAGTHNFMDYEFARLSYDFKSDKCAFPRPESIFDWADVKVPFYRESQFTNLKMNEIDLHLRTVGPVFVNLRTWKNFKLQGNGIYGKLEESDNPTIHSMLIVGHNKDAHGRDYWLIWNSHGTAWGEQGLVRVYTKSLEFFKVYLGGFLTTEISDFKQQN